MRRAALAVGALAALLLSAGPATASRVQRSIFEDDQTLVLSSPTIRERTLDDLSTLGVDTVHSVVFWNRVAPAPLSTHRPAGFDGANPAAYPAALWDRYDGLVRGAQARGMDVLLSPSSPMPAWASGCHASRKVRRVCRPNPTQFKRFVQALGTRYSGTYADEDEGGGILPRVARWSIWNEPNQGGWLQPQATRRGPLAPALYRELVRAAIKGLRESGHGSDEILFGETAPIGRRSGPATSRPTPPAMFLRDALCIDGRGHALRGRARRSLDCGGHFARLPVTGIAHHPYTRGGSRPPTAKGTSTEITISSISRLKSILRQAGARRRLPRRLPIQYTEFGFQTNPPDGLFGVSLAKQAAWINESDFIAWHDPSVRAVAQYEMRDEASLAAFQTGLRFIDGRAKPSWAAYRLPLWVARRGSRLLVWGQLRSAPDGSVEQVDVQNAPTAHGTFTTVRTLTVRSRKGFFTVKLPRRSGVWRASWTPAAGGGAVLSRVARPAR
jgi:hypothetical protein